MAEFEEDEYDDQQEGQEEDFLQFPEDEDFGTWVQSQLRRTPWFMASAVIHVFALMMAVLLAPTAVPEADAAVITAQLPPDTQNMMEEPPPDEVKTDKLIKNDVKVDEPVVTDRTDETNETDNDEEFEMAKGDPNFDSAADLTGDQTLDGIGIGGGGGGHFGGRLGGKADKVRGGGGSPATENAVIDALRWLMRHQSEDGSWDVDGYHNHCDPAYGQACDGVGSVDEGDPGVTGLALLAYLGAGYTHDDGSEFAETVLKGLKYLKNVQDDEGFFAKEKTSHFFMYGHSIATLAMTEAFGLTGQEIFKTYAQRGIDVIINAQNDHPEKDGEKFGWRYFPNDGDNDTSVAGWMIMALKSAKTCGFDIPEATMRGGSNWLEFVTDEVYYRAGYNTPGGGSALPSELRDKFRTTETATAIAILSRVFLGESPKNAAVRAGASLLASDKPQWNVQDGSIDFYYWYYGTLAMFQVGGEHWKAWNECMKEAIVDHQLKRKDGCQWGSWDPKVAKWGGRGGRVYTTAINCLTLEVYYRYDKVFK